jgi:hypothetical protein
LEDLMKTLFHIACAVLLCCAGVSCSESPYEPSQEELDAGIVYFNSFESAADTLGWEGITGEMFVGDPAPGGGERSLHISGDCIQPTAHIVFPPDGSDRGYILGFWGKLDDARQTGTLILAVKGDDGQREERALTVDGDQWTFYRSEKPLYTSADEALRLEIMIGGIVSASMSIDHIIIEEFD